MNQEQQIMYVRGQDKRDMVTRVNGSLPNQLPSLFNGSTITSQNTAASKNSIPTNYQFQNTDLYYPNNTATLLLQETASSTSSQADELLKAEKIKNNNLIDILLHEVGRNFNAIEATTSAVTTWVILSISRRGAMAFGHERLNKAVGEITGHYPNKETWMQPPKAANAIGDHLANFDKAFFIKEQGKDGKIRFKVNKENAEKYGFSHLGLRMYRNFYGNSLACRLTSMAITSALTMYRGAQFTDNIWSPILTMGSIIWINGSQQFLYGRKWKNGIVNIGGLKMPFQKVQNAIDVSNSAWKIAASTARRPADSFTRLLQNLNGAFSVRRLRDMKRGTDNRVVGEAEHPKSKSEFLWAGIGKTISKMFTSTFVYTGNALLFNGFGLFFGPTFKPITDFFNEVLGFNRKKPKIDPNFSTTTA